MHVYKVVAPGTHQNMTDEFAVIPGNIHPVVVFAPQRKRSRSAPLEKRYWKSWPQALTSAEETAINRFRNSLLSATRQRGNATALFRFVCVLGGVFTADQRRKGEKQSQHKMHNNSNARMIGIEARGDMQIRLQNVHQHAGKGEVPCRVRGGDGAAREDRTKTKQQAPA